MNYLSLIAGGLVIAIIVWAIVADYYYSKLKAMEAKFISAQENCMGWMFTYHKLTSSLEEHSGYLRSKGVKL